VLSFVVGYLQKLPCHAAGWPWQRDLIFGRYCYSDVPMLFRTRGLVDGVFPYAPNAGEHPLEYPVLTGVVMDATARLTRALDGRDTTFFELTLLVMLACALVTVWAVAHTAGTRAAYLVAAAPALALSGTINWDLLAVAAATLAVLAWSRDRPALAGACLGLGAAAKLYPALLLFPLLVICLRERRLRAFGTALGSAAVTWLAVNLPVALAYPDGWLEFWRFNADRQADFGSLWYALDLLGVHVGRLNAVATGCFLVLCAGIAAHAWRTRAEFAPLGFLVVAAFCVTNKVYSPQYVLWMLPLAVLAGVRVRDWAIWQAAEVLYWLAVWQYLAWTLSPAWLYPAATFVRIAATVYLAGKVVTLAADRPVPAPPSTSARPARSPVEC
jgi:uncharacterized membrane protein